MSTERSCADSSSRRRQRDRRHRSVGKSVYFKNRRRFFRSPRGPGSAVARIRSHSRGLVLPPWCSLARRDRARPAPLSCPDRFAESRDRVPFEHISRPAPHPHAQRSCSAWHRGDEHDISARLADPGATCSARRAGPREREPRSSAARRGVSTRRLKARPAGLADFVTYSGRPYASNPSASCDGVRTAPTWGGGVRCGAPGGACSGSRAVPRDGTASPSAVPPCRHA